MTTSVTLPVWVFLLMLALNFAWFALGLYVARVQQRKAPPSRSWPRTTTPTTATEVRG